MKRNRVTLLLMLAICITFAADAATAPRFFSKGYLIYGDGAGVLTEYGRLVHVSEMHLECWRLITTIFLHAGIPHLLVNLLALYVSGTLLERETGGITFSAVFWGTGILASAVNMFWTHGAVGASGAIYGVTGYLFASGSFHRKEKRAGLKLAILLLYLTLPNLSGNTAVIAHAAGFMTGAGLGLLSFAKKRKEKSEKR